jgi:hypothetical protein
MQEDWTLKQRVLDFLRLRKRAYQLTFQGRKNNEVLKDLAKFCGANKSPKFFDLYRIGIAVGRREVWLRIQEHLELQPEELYEIYNRPATLQPPTKE